MTTTEVTPAATAARGTFIDAIHVDELFVDHTYQRELDGTRAHKLAASWDRRLAGVIEVSDRGPDHSPRYAVIDGQHRMQAAKLLDPAPFMVATIHEGLSVADEARLFDRLNRQRRQPTTWDHWRARKSTAATEVLALEAVVNGLGLRIDNTPTEGNVRCTATLEKLYRLGGADLVHETLKLIVGVWDVRRDAYDAPIVGGLGLVLHYLREPIDRHRLADTLLGTLPVQLTTQAVMQPSGTKPVRIAIAIMDRYNRNRHVPGRAILVSPRTFGGGSRNARSAPASTAPSTDLSRTA